MYKHLPVESQLLYPEDYQPRDYHPLTSDPAFNSHMHADRWAAETRFHEHYDEEVAHSFKVHPKGWDINRQWFQLTFDLGDELLTPVAIYGYPHEGAYPGRSAEGGEDLFIQPDDYESEA